MSTVALIDASGWIHRAYHAMPPLARRSDGHPIGCVLGFSTMLWALRKRQNSGVSHLAAIFDAGGRTYRHEILNTYKGNRKPKDDDLGRQFPLVREAAAAFGVPVIELPGHEADDIIATYTRIACGLDYDVLIYGADKDLMQLVAPNVRLYDSMKRLFIDEQAVVQKFGVPPEQMTQLQALMGDPTDNIPGVPGIGVVNAAKIISFYGDIETAIAAAMGDGAELPGFMKPGIRAALREHAEAARLSLRLATLNPVVPLDNWSLDPLLARDVDVEAVLAFLDRMEISELTNTIKREWGVNG